MSIQKAGVADAEEIKVLVSSLSHFYLEDQSAALPDWLSATLTTSAFVNRLSSADFDNFVYIKNDSIVGYLSFKEQSHVYHFFVSEDHHGEGISRALWRHATSLITADVYTVRSSIYAVPVYKRFGFKVVEPAASKDGVGFQLMQLVL